MAELNGNNFLYKIYSDIIINIGNGSITLKDSKNVPLNITTKDNAQIIAKDGVYTYTGGDRTIKDYSQDAQINLASDYTGIGLDNNNFYVNSSSGSLKIENACDKLISYGDATGNLVAYSFMASDGGDIDNAEIIIGGNNSSNQMYAGSGGSSLWSGEGGADTLIGGEGYDEFFYAVGSGSDVMQSVGDNVNLLGVTLDQISGIEINIGQLNINFIDGGSLQVQGGDGVAYRIAEGTFQVNQSIQEWSAK